MDWYKSKTILIIALLVTNIFLLGIYISRISKVDESVSLSFIKETESILSEAGIGLEVKIPRDNNGVVPPFAKTVNFKNQRLNNDFFKGQGQVNVKNSRLVEISHDGEVIEIYGGRSFIYRSNKGEAFVEDMEDAQDLVNEFLREKNLLTDNTIIDYKFEEDGRYFFYFANKSEGWYVEDCKLQVVVGKNGIEKIEKEWVELEEPGSEQVFINTAPKALRALVSYPELRGKSIISIEICYYLPLDNYEEDKSLIGIRAKTIPAWRILFSDGTKFILSDN